jgi:hypothetical protein
MRETNMKKFITKQILGIGALLCASAAIAGTVEVRPDDSLTPLSTAGSCIVISSRCELTTTSNTFSIIVVGLNQPGTGSTTVGTTGATLGLRFSTVSGGTLDWTAADGSTVLPTFGQKFDPPAANPDPGTTATPIAPVDTCDNIFDCLLTAVPPTSGALPGGTIVAFVVKFTATGPGTYLIDIDDDGADLSWTNNAGNTANTYTQARVIVSAVPVPAAAWLLLSGLGSLVGLKRFRRQ